MKLQQYYITKNPYYVSNVKKTDSRYTTFQSRGPLGLVLHSVGCAQPSAKVFADRENVSTCQVAVHGFIDANTGVVYQTLPWNYRAAHCGSAENNTHVGVEMCESSYVKYKGTGDRFTVTNSAAALAHAKVAYDAAVELFAWLCDQYKLDPLKAGVIRSHNEIGSGHTDPEHYWTQLGAPYTMDGFRNDVKAKLGKVTVTEVTASASAKAIPTISCTMPKLSQGCQGEAVKSLQQLLIAKGYSCGSAGADGDFGSGTLAALKKYQAAQQIDVDGVAGAQTWGRLIPA